MSYSVIMLHMQLITGSFRRLQKIQNLKVYYVVKLGIDFAVVYLLKMSLVQKPCSVIYAVVKLASAETVVVYYVLKPSINLLDITIPLDVKLISMAVLVAIGVTLNVLFELTWLGR